MGGEQGRESEGKRMKEKEKRDTPERERERMIGKDGENLNEV